MKAKDRVKSVTTTFKADVDERGILSLEKVAQTVITDKLDAVRAKVESFKTQRRKSGDTISVWKRIKYEMRTVYGKNYKNGSIKRRVLVNKWIQIDVREIPIAPIKVKYKPVYITPRKVIQPARFKHTSCPKRANLTHHFKDALKKNNVGTQTFNDVKYAIKRYTKIEHDIILNRLAELRFLKYPKSMKTDNGKSLTMRRYAEMINDKSNEALRKVVSS